MNHKSKIDVAGVALPGLGETVGNCRLISLIGEGAIGVVFKGFEVDLELERAIKILKPNAGEYVRKKFEAEAKVTARLDHPNIVKVLGGGIWNSTLPFMQMDFLDGKSLRQLLLAHQTFHPAVCLSIIYVTSTALEYASSQTFSIWGNRADTLVHRDLKPENVMITRSGVLKVMDFGLAQLGNETQQSGWGTPQYMSPEQHEHGEVDCRSDLYSLGIMLYEMVCGKRPFSDSPETMPAEKARGAFKPVAFYNPAVLQSLSALAERCLSPDKTRRPQTYTALKDLARKILFEITPLNPEDIIRLFSRNPGDFALPPKEKHARRVIPRAPLISAIAVFALAVGFIVMKRTGQFCEKEMLAPSNEQLVAENAMRNTAPTADSPPLANAVVPVEKPRSRTGLPLKTIARNSNEPVEQSRPALPRRAAVSAITPGSAATHLKPGVLSHALDQYRANRPSGVIAAINDIPLQSLPSPTRDSALVLLAESYYRTSSLQEIIDLSKNQPTNDSRFCLVVSLAYETLGDFVSASRYMDKVIISPSVLGGDSRNELLFKRARFYQRRFYADPREDNKNAMLQAFRLFLTDSCSDNSPDCQTAREILDTNG